MRKWIVSLVALSLVLATAGAVAAHALSSDDVGTDREGSGGELLEPSEGWVTATSIDDIYPNKCNFIHNINACSPEELQAFGIYPISGSTGIADPSDPGVEVEDQREPGFVDGEPGYPTPTTAIECGEGEGVYVTSNGETGCTVTRNLEDDGPQESQGQLPQVEPQKRPAYN